MQPWIQKISTTGASRSAPTKRQAVERRAYPTLLEAYSLILFRLGKNAASNWLADVADASLANFCLSG
jgi:hypothetical protein